jgi:hypothetical protein
VYWSARERARLSLDCYIALLALLADLPIIFRYGSADIVALSVSAHLVKLVQLVLCSRWLLSPSQRYRNWRRSALVVTERIMRCGVFHLYSYPYDEEVAAARLLGVPASPLVAALRSLKILAYGSGAYTSFWHSQLNPVGGFRHLPGVVVRALPARRARLLHRARAGPALVITAPSP